MSARAARWLAWSLFGLFVALAAATPVLVAVRNGNASDALVATGIGFALVGALIAARHPANAVGWLLLVAAVALGVDTLMSVYVHRAAANIAGTAFAPGVLDIRADRPIRNPLGIGGPVGDAHAWLSGAGELLAAGTLVLGGLSVFLRLRRSRGRERQQVTWFAYICIVALVPFVVLALVSLVAGDDVAPWLNVVQVFAWWSLVALLLIGLPSAIGIAILRHRLYDAARTLAAFGARLRDELDVDALGNDLRAAVRDTMQPAHVSLWVRKADR
jgi:hypothetical protein